MRLSELERWLWRQGWRPERNKRGSHRAWTHPAYPDQRLTYHGPHKADGAELRPDVISHIYKKIAAMRPVEQEQEQENQEAS